MRALLAVALLAGTFGAPAHALTCPPGWYDDISECSPVATDSGAAGVRCDLNENAPNEYVLSGGPVVVPDPVTTTYSCFAHELLVEETHDGPIAYMDSRTLTYPVHPMYLCTQVYWTRADDSSGTAILGCYWR